MSEKEPSFKDEPKAPSLIGVLRAAAINRRGILQSMTKEQLEAVLSSDEGEISGSLDD